MSIRWMVKLLRRMINPRKRLNQEIEKIKSLVDMTAHTEDRELSCGEAYQDMDVFVDRLLAGEDTAKLMPEIKSHLERCPECREEYEALLKIVRDLSV